MNITENGLHIRETRADDADILCEWWNNGELMKDVGFPKGLNLSREKVLWQIENPRGMHLLMLETGGRPIGEANYKDKGNKTVEIGIKIAPSMQNKGYGTLFTKLMVKTLFEMDYDKIVLDTNLENLRAQRVYEKTGFNRTAVLENTWTDQLGNPRGHIEYELLKKDFIK